MTGSKASTESEIRLIGSKSSGRFRSSFWPTMIVARLPVYGKEL